MRNWGDQHAPEGELLGAGASWLQERDLGRVNLAWGRDPTLPELIEVTVVHHQPDGSGEASAKVVGLYHHVGNRYRASQLTPQEARSLAAWLVDAADRAEEMARPSHTLVGGGE